MNEVLTPAGKLLNVYSTRFPTCYEPYQDNTFEITVAASNPTQAAKQAVRYLLKQGNLPTNENNFVILVSQPPDPRVIKVEVKLNFTIQGTII